MIELTVNEIEKLAEYLSCTADVEYRVRAIGLIDALNKLRAPDPLGTVRADEDGNVAVKTNDYACDQWHVHRVRSARCSGPESAEYVADWPVVYMPEVVKR